MKRIHLHDPGAQGVDLGLLRTAALLLARYATANGSRSLGDPIVDDVTEKRLAGNVARRARGSPERAYSSCGDLPHWMLRCLGCRDESLVNRDDDGGEHPWAVGVNISRLAGSPLVVQAVRHPELSPDVGDTVFVMNVYGGHVCVVESWDESEGLAVTHDYGQALPTVARRRSKRIEGHGPRLTLDGNPVLWWLPIDRVPLSAPAEVPDEMQGGEAAA